MTASKDSKDSSETYKPILHLHKAKQGIPHGTVLIAHGYAEHQGRFTELVKVLNDAGWDAITYDHRGHGEAPGDRAVVDVDQLINDHITARHEARELMRANDGVGNGLVLFGHSMGGLITAASAERDGSHLRGVILTGPAFEPLPAMPLPLMQVLRQLARLTPKLPIAGLKNDKICHDPEVIKSYDEDPNVYRGKVPLLTATSMMIEGHKAARHGGDIKVPVLILHGSDDALANPDGSRRFANSMRSNGGDVILRVLPNLYHEVLNEPNRAESYKDIVEFLQKKIA